MAQKYKKKTTCAILDVKKLFFRQNICICQKKVVILQAENN